MPSTSLRSGIRLWQSSRVGLTPLTPHGRVAARAWEPPLSTCGSIELRLFSGEPTWGPISVLNSRAMDEVRKHRAVSWCMRVSSLSFCCVCLTRYYLSLGFMGRGASVKKRYMTQTRSAGPAGWLAAVAEMRPNNKSFKHQERGTNVVQRVQPTHILLPESCGARRLHHRTYSQTEELTVRLRICMKPST